MKKLLSHLLLLFLFGLTPPLAAEPETGLRAAYQLRVDDVLSLSVYQEPDLEKTAVIGRDGKASFRLIDMVPLEGLTLSEATARIHDLYGAGYLRFPRITLAVTQYAQGFVQVSGQVNTPGGIPVPKHGQIDLLSALTNAGWVTPLADLKNIEVKTAALGQSDTYSLEEIRGAKGARLLESGDQIIAHVSPFALSKVTVQGKVNKPGTIAIPNDGKLTLATALEEAGGLTPDADFAAIKFTRANESFSFHSHLEIRTGAAGRTLLQAGDRVHVRVSPFVNTTVAIMGAVNKRGQIAFPLDGRLHLMGAIAQAGDFSDLANRKKVRLSRPGKEPFILDTKKLTEQGRVVWLMPNDVVTVIERLF
jgi:protein involved in polysaccharide export with SLBB domain